jgi:integrase
MRRESSERERSMMGSMSYSVIACGQDAALAVREAGRPETPKPRLLDRFRAAVRLRHYSRRTEKAYVAWTRRYGRVAASTQNQALSALLFLYRAVLDIDVPWLDGIIRAKRVQDIDFGANQIVVRGAKGDKDRVTVLPSVIKRDPAQHLETTREQHRQDVQSGAGWVALPTALIRKYPNAGCDWVWQWVFPATRFYLDRETGTIWGA